MMRVVDNSAEFLSKLKANNLDTLEAIGKFSKGVMDDNVAVDTGLLKSNNDYVVSQDEVQMSNSTEYAVHQEYGTHKMKAHPFMKPAALNHTGDLARIAAEQLGKGMKGKG